MVARTLVSDEDDRTQQADVMVPDWLEDPHNNMEHTAGKNSELDTGPHEKNSSQDGDGQQPRQSRYGRVYRQPDRYMFCVQQEVVTEANPLTPTRIRLPNHLSTLAEVSEKRMRCSEN